MKVLVAGSGAREHALAWACARSPLVTEVACAPGNGGTAALGRNLPVAADDVEGMVQLALAEDVDLVVIGPDAAVAAGLAEALDVEGIDCFGPTAAAGRIEWSKEYAKDVMNDGGIPTARWVGAGRATRDRAVHFIEEHRGFCVVKADGLALGKGVTVCSSVEEALAALDACLVEERFGDAGARVIVEERLSGREVSVFALSDGMHVHVLAPACDYKRAFDGDTGPMTGGMGSYAPPTWLDTDALLDEAMGTVLQPCVDILRERGTPYRGLLYAGLMLTAEGLRVLEFNARFGDPETQVVLPLLAEDPVPLFVACAQGGLLPGRAACVPGAAVGVVAASGGYPGAVETGKPISGLDSLDPDVLVFHGGTRRGDDGTLLTSGGRVLTVVGRGDTLDAARARAYAGIERISFEGMRHRGDIALQPQFVPGVTG
ncbi:MAG TPA: phosphoribosylamine--glycine ligase [Candidatus Dormibacteraeota bacterium]|nr:phosphoribosylamine--glycine ligase [Candidatus Dormibacteraeota bacterium]